MDFKQSIKKTVFAKKTFKKIMDGAGFFAEVSISSPSARDQMAFISGFFIRDFVL